MLDETITTSLLIIPAAFEAIFVLLYGKTRVTVSGLLSLAVGIYSLLWLTGVVPPLLLIKI